MAIRTKSHQWLTTSEVAHAIGVHPKTVAAWQRRGIFTIPFQTLPSGHRRYRVEDVEAYLAGAR